MFSDLLVIKFNVQNKAFVLRGPLDVAFEDRPIPKITDPYSVLIRVEFTGICGSDVHYWCNGRLGPFVLESPMVLGHESAGTVVKTGSKVQSLQQGDRVAMEPGISCRRCDRCKEGNYNLCLDMAFAATPPYDGTLATYYVLPADLCYKLPEHVSLEEGSMLEPLSVAVHILRQSNIKHGDSVVVFGAGPIGLLCCAVAKAYGAQQVVAVDIQDQRLDFASKFTATATYKPTSASPEENAERLKKEHNLGTGADVVLDASGAEASIQTAIHVLRHGGSYVQAGLGHDQVLFPIAGACTKELTIRGSFRYSAGDYQTALNLVATGNVDVNRLITSKVRFEEAESAFQTVKAGKAIKVLIAGPK